MAWIVTGYTKDSSGGVGRIFGPYPNETEAREAAKALESSGEYVLVGVRDDPDVPDDIPAMQEGGLADEPSIAGEAGDEIVLPANEDAAETAAQDAATEAAVNAEHAADVAEDIAEETDPQGERSTEIKDVLEELADWAEEAAEDAEEAAEDALEAENVGDAAEAAVEAAEAGEEAEKAADAAVAVAAETSDAPPEPTHWFYRKRGRR